MRYRTILQMCRGHTNALPQGGNILIGKTYVCGSMICKHNALCVCVSIILALCEQAAPLDCFCCLAKNTFLDVLDHYLVAFPCA